MTPTRAQRFFVRLFGEGVERESREWLAICSKCGHERSIWELGGVRFKAASKGKRQRMRCPACGEAGWHRIERRKTG